MASGRILKTQISFSEQVNDLSLKSALLFTWMIPHADDFGRMRGSGRQIKAQVVPMRDDFTSIDVSDCLEELNNKKLIILYEHEGDKFIQFPRWEEHQSGLHKRTKSKFPEHVPGNSGKFPIEENRREQKRTGTEENRTEQECSTNQKNQNPIFDEVFDFWKTTMEHPKSNLKPEDKKIIKSAIGLGYSAEDLKLAILGCSKTPHNMGANENNSRYDGLHICLKTSNIDRFITTARKQTGGNYEKNINSSRKLSLAERAQLDVERIDERHRQEYSIN